MTRSIIGLSWECEGVQLLKDIENLAFVCLVQRIPTRMTGSPVESLQVLSWKGTLAIFLKLSSNTTKDVAEILEGLLRWWLWLLAWLPWLTWDSALLWHFSFVVLCLRGNL